MLEAKTVREIERHLGRIADALERIVLAAPPIADQTECAHENREPMPDSTMTNLRYRCTDCGEGNLP